MKVNWHDVATIVATMTALGGIMLALMRGFFVTTSSCSETQRQCQGTVCKKIDELKQEMKENRKHYAEIKEALGVINGKLSNE